MAGQFCLGNEPSFAIPYIYNRLGAPWKTQSGVRMLVETFFPDTRQGIPGDEDGGTMSSWVVCITANHTSRDNKYVPSIVLNGKPLIAFGFVMPISSTAVHWFSR